MSEDSNSPLIFEITDVSGVPVKVEIVAHFFDNERMYVIANDLSNDTDSYILELVTTESGSELISIDDEAEYERLCELVERLQEE